MNADIKGALNQIEISWKSFTHRGQPMKKDQVIAVLEYVLEKDYKHTGLLTQEEVDSVLASMPPKVNPEEVV